MNEIFGFLRPKYQERWVLLMRPDDPLAAKEAVSPEDLKEVCKWIDYGCIAINRDESSGPCA
ncbi:MAG: substrate-binding domain-containing protein [Clostridiales bacterium]|nr:substrate-binding domain-containing protein [Clostridiales bacterium]